MDTLDRMFQVLVRTLRAKNPALLTAPFTVGELHSQILPYRHFRRELGLETNQEYELVLMELLTGARGYLDVDERLRDELGKELHAGTPEPSRVLEFADAHVSINAKQEAKVSEAQPAMAPPSSRGQTTAINDFSVTGPATTASPVSRCKYCGGNLPTDRAMTFCPYCGQNLQVLNCAACGAEVEAGWKFCVACGKAVT
jgi:hypothetical protein